eukprot:superscaffoldBa00001561_g11091
MNDLEEDEDRPVSPVSSCLSMRSDSSKGLNFSNQPGPSDAKGQYQRAESLVSSCLSMKSDWSKDSPPFFSNEPGPSDTKGQYQRAESPVSSCLSMKSDWSKDSPPFFSNEPGPSDTKERNGRGVSVEEQLSCCSLCQDTLKDPVSTSCGLWLCRQCTTSYWHQSASSGDSSCPKCAERSRTTPGLQTDSQSSTVQSSPVTLTGNQKMSGCVEEEDKSDSSVSTCVSKDHPPDFGDEAGSSDLQFRCPGPGVFQCTLTRVVFVMTQEAELLYSTVQWDERVLLSAGKMAAGPLFNIQSPDGAVSQLQLPHCETMDGLLSVVHITDDGMSILEPLEITDTHVSAQQRNADYITAPSKCKLMEDHSYNILCPKAFKIQPKKADFDLEFGPNYHPTFEVRLPINTNEVALKVQDQRNTEVWEHEVDLTATITTVGERLLDKLQCLGEEDFKDFKWFLHRRNLIPAELPCIPWSKLEKADMKGVVDLIEQTYSQRAVAVTKMLFKKINRNDLVMLL